MAGLVFGIGYIKPSVSYLLLFTLFFYFSRNAHHLTKTIFGAIVGTLWVLFFLSYYKFFIPPDLPWGRIPLDFYRYFQVAIQIILIYHLILSLNEIKDAIRLVFAVSLGMMIFALSNMYFTISLLDPPYYGKAYHSIHKFVYNSPGTTILGSMLPIVMISFWKKGDFILSTYNIMLFTSIIGCIGISIVFTARTPILILVIATILKVTFENFKINKKFILYSLLSICVLIIASYLMTLIFSEYANTLFNRLVYGDYSEKIGHHIDYWNQIKENFYIYPVSFHRNHYHYWFHNFFFDNHRTSGPITAIISYLIFSLAFIKSSIDLYLKKEYGKEIFILFILFIPFLITTIPWESSESQMIGLYAGITALIFRNKVSKSK
jgi:hypothetical protein